MQIVTKNLSRPIPPLWDDPLTAALAAASKTTPLKEGFSGERIVFSTGRENDGIGLYYYRARYYSPTLQRFVSEDPIGLAGGDLNFYGYVGNNPVNRIDPSGLISWGGVLGWGFDAGGMATSNTGTWGYYGGVVLGTAGALGGSLLGGSVGGFAGGLIGGYAGEFLFGLLDSPCAGQLNCGEDISGRK